MLGTGEFLAHGLGLEPVQSDWPPLTAVEVQAVLAAIDELGDLRRVTLLWRSPRPYSAAALVSAARAGQGPARQLFVKRHHRSVRTLAGLGEEHAFARHLTSHGLPVATPLGAVELPAVELPAVELPAGELPAIELPAIELPATDAAPGLEATGPANGAACGWTYEVHEALDGDDTYRDALSWTPYRSAGHARAAGRALAAVHRAAESYAASERQPAPLMSSSSLTAAEDLVEAIARYAAGRPGLASYLDTRPWVDEVRRHLVPWHRMLHETRAVSAPSWCHGDWHPSNLLWSGGCDDAEVVGIIDLGLCNKATVAYDLATALERSVVGWLEPALLRPVHLDQARALIAGYRTGRALPADELAALVGLLPIVHVEFALSEVEYFHAVVGSPASAALAYEGYLLGHADWFTSPAGAALLAQLEG